MQAGSPSPARAPGAPARAAAWAEPAARRGPRAGRHREASPREPAAPARAAAQVRSASASSLVDAQILEGPRQPRVDGARGQLQQLGDLRRRVPEPVAQHDDGAPLETQTGHGVQQLAILVSRSRHGDSGSATWSSPTSRRSRRIRSSARLTTIRCSHAPNGRDSSNRDSAANARSNASWATSSAISRRPVSTSAARHAPGQYRPNSSPAASRDPDRALRTSVASDARRTISTRVLRPGRHYASRQSSTPFSSQPPWPSSK